ncbi:hypothetical protein BSY15_2323 [Acidovorax sp. RAC01]|nr:hypothetical protein BSY15_2323 [Acidovorax sp. RAC01]
MTMSLQDLVSLLLVQAHRLATYALLNLSEDVALLALLFC